VRKKEEKISLEIWKLQKSVLTLHSESSNKKQGDVPPFVAEVAAKKFFEKSDRNDKSLENEVEHFVNSRKQSGQTNRHFTLCRML